MSALQLDDHIQETSTAVGTKALNLVRELYPIGRSITGAGLRATVERLSRIVPLEITEVASGTPVFDWTVPDEWTIDEAFIEHESGRRFADLRESSLHVMGYSTPVDATMAHAPISARSRCRSTASSSSASRRRQACRLRSTIARHIATNPAP